MDQISANTQTQFDIPHNLLFALKDKTFFLLKFLALCCDITTH